MTLPPTPEALDLDDERRADRFHDECGVFGVYGHGEASNLAYLGIHALQHRGQESAGIAALDAAGALNVHRGMGLVADVFARKDVFGTLPGDAAIGHTRYSTAGHSVIANAQPMLARTTAGPIAVAHNGNLVNAEELRAELAGQGALFQGSSDTEVLLHLVARETGTALERIQKALARVRGAYSLLFLTADSLIAVRDPLGFRPLILGRLRGAWVFASETCALDLIEAEPIREVEPGELVIVDAAGVRTVQSQPPQRAGRCIFELIYFARPDSQVFGRSVYMTRKALGRRLAQEHPAEADLVIPVPDSGVPAALGYAEESGLPYELGLIRSHYVGRTFIEPSQSIRHFGVKLKLNPVPAVVRGKRVVVVDDSIVRGTTSRKIVKMVRDAGAREVHLRISAPPTKWPCYYGIDTPVRSELIAASHTHDEIVKYVTADSLGYLSAEGMHAAAQAEKRGFCDACFTGEYLVQLAAPRSEPPPPGNGASGATAAAPAAVASPRAP